MVKQNFIIFFIIFSSILHIIIFSLFSFCIDAKGDPLFYGWLNAISRKDLFLKDKDPVFPPGLAISPADLRNNYFSSISLGPIAPLKNINNKDFLFPDDEEISVSKGWGYDEKACFYLWERSKGFSSWDEETVSYEVYVSGYGKVLLLYPEKLPIDSSANLHLQEYIRESAFFLVDKFFWTKLEGVVN